MKMLELLTKYIFFYITGFLPLCDVLNLRLISATVNILFNKMKEPILMSYDIKFDALCQLLPYNFMDNYA